MGSGASGVNGYAFPEEPEDGTVAPDEGNGIVDYVGLGLALLVVLGCIVVGIRIVLGLLDGSPLL